LRVTEFTMSDDSPTQARERVEEVYRSESRHVLAMLIRLLGDFDAAEEALHEAFVAATEQSGGAGGSAHRG